MPTVREEIKSYIDSIQAVLGRHEKISSNKIAALVATVKNHGAVAPNHVLRMFGLKDNPLIRIHQEPLGDCEPLGNIVLPTATTRYIDVYMRVPGQTYPEAYLCILIHEISHFLLSRVSIYYSLNEKITWLTPLVLGGSTLRDLFNQARAQITMLNRPFGLEEGELYAALFYIEDQEIYIQNIKNKLNSELLNMDTVRASIVALGETLGKFRNTPMTEQVLRLCRRELTSIECEATAIARQKLLIQQSIDKWTISDWLSLAPSAHNTPEVEKQMALISSLKTRRDRLALILSSATDASIWEPFGRAMAQYISQAT